MKNKSITIAALIIAIIGLSIGFAAFSNTLTIRSSASVSPDSSNFRVVFSKSTSSAQAGNVSPDNAQYGGTANINSEDLTILENLHATFTAPGQSVTYPISTDTLYVYNAGSYRAQLTGITFENAQDSNTYKKCTIKTTDINGNTLGNDALATQSLVDAACEEISISVTIGTASNVTPTSQDKTLNHQIIDVGGHLDASVTISYTGESYVDGPMSVSFGDIKIGAITSVDENAVVIPQQQEPEEETNPWLTRGLTSTNVVYDRPYRTSGEAFMQDEITLNSDGSISIGSYFDNSTVTSLLNSIIHVGNNYFIITTDGASYAYVYGENGTMTLYYAESENITNLDDIIDQDIAEAASKDNHYTVSQGQ